MGTPILREENALRSSNVAMFQEHPCSQNPCQNGGHCNPQLDTYECVCLNGFSGGHCQNSEYLWLSLSFILTAILYLSLSADNLDVKYICYFKYNCKDQYDRSACKPMDNNTCWLETTLSWQYEIAMNHWNCTNCSISSSNIIWFFSKWIHDNIFGCF